MAGLTLSRRRTLEVLGLGGLALGWPGAARAAYGSVRPWLYTPEQLRCERMLLTLEPDPEIRAIQQLLKKELSATARGRIPDAAATLDRAIAAWTRSLVLSEANDRPSRPFFLWITDDTPREWLGHKLGGVGMSGDNPDAIYRTTVIEGGGRYEMTGRFHPAGPPTQFLFEVNRGSMTRPQNIMPVTDGKHEDIHNSAFLSDRDLVVGPDGSFRITMSPDSGAGWASANHLVIPGSGTCVAGVREIMSDWAQKPSKLSIRRLDRVRPEAWTLATVREKVLRDLYGYIAFWARFPDIWFGGLRANTRSDPQARPGGWGYVAGLNFSLGRDEAMLVTSHHGDARYTGFQINDPWMIAPDARKLQVCLNNTQTVWNADGTATYVIGPTDPGVANWLDTEGMHDGIGIMRWQQIAPDLRPDGLIREMRVVKLAEVAAMAGLPRVTPEQRRAQVDARWAAYSSRTL